MNNTRALDLLIVSLFGLLGLAQGDSGAGVCESARLVQAHERAHAGSTDGRPHVQGRLLGVAGTGPIFSEGAHSGSTGMRPAVDEKPLVAAGDVLSFEDRVQAQTAIERVYHGHLVGATQPFERAVSRAVIESKVRTSLRQSVALEQIWGQHLTGGHLEAEMRRIASGTRFPERLAELYGALDHDAVLVQECLARPLLVDRLVRRRLAFDPKIQNERRLEAERLRTILASDPASLNRGDFGHLEGPFPGRESTDEQAFPHVGHVQETEDAFVVRAIPATADPIRAENAAGPDHAGDGDGSRDVLGVSLSARNAADARITGATGSAWAFPRVRTDAAENGVVWRVPKVSWEVWWTENASRFDPAAARTVALPLAALPAPSASSTPGSPPGLASSSRIPELASTMRASLSVTATPACPPEDIWENGSLDDGPDAGVPGSAIWTGSLMLVWGFPYRPDGFRYDPLTDTWSHMRAVGAPFLGDDFTTVWTGSEMVVWGGTHSTQSAPGGRYDPSSDTWRPISPVGGPVVRWGHVAVWTGDRMIVWAGGGRMDGGVYDPANDSWSLIGPGGVFRDFGSAVWTGSEMVVWGGSDGNPTLPTFGVRYNLAQNSWAAFSGTNPPPGRIEHSMVWTGTRMIVWGGLDGTYAKLGDGSAYDPATNTWTPVASSGAPAARAYHSAVWTGSQMIVWGGEGLGGLLSDGGVYDLASATWAPMANDGAPMFRKKHVAVWTGTEMVVWGGQTFMGELFKLHTGGRYDPVDDVWVPTSTGPAPPGRSGHTGVWTGNHVLVFGGSGGETLARSDGHRYDPTLDAWTPISASGAPVGRTEHVAVWTGSRMIVWGGAGSTVKLQDGGRYDPVADSWTPMSVLGAPSARTGATAVWTGSLMIVWGGSQFGSSNLATGGRYDPVADTWQPTTELGAPTGRGYHTAVWTGSRMVVWGGLNNTGPLVYFDSGGRYDPVGDVWTATSTLNAPTARASNGVWTGTRMLVWGGLGNAGVLDTGALYDPSQDSWTTMTTAGAPSSGVSMVWTGKLVVTWGSEGGRYDPALDQWRPMTPLGRPGERNGPAIAWTGSHMFVWGGSWFPDVARTGGMYRPGDTDSDLDGTQDVCDPCVHDVQNDGDADGVCGDVDNCAAVRNPLQRDGDGDGHGDACDTCPAAIDPGQADGDGDGAGDICDCEPQDPNDRRPAEVGGLDATRGPFGETLLTWTADPRADVYSVSRGDLSARGAGAYGACLVNGLFSPAYQDSQVPPAGRGWFYIVQAQSFDCGLGTLGAASNESERENDDPAACAGLSHQDRFASGDTAVDGHVSGGLANTTVSDGIVQAITEALSSGPPSSRFSRLEHRWTIPVTSGNRIEFHVEASRTLSTDGDDFHFEWSTDGAIWSPITLPGLPYADDAVDLIASLPATLSGNVTFRVQDTDRTAGNQTLDTIRVDQMWVRTVP